MWYIFSLPKMFTLTNQTSTMRGHTASLAHLQVDTDLLVKTCVKQTPARNQTIFVDRSQVSKFRSFIYTLCIKKIIFLFSVNFIYEDVDT